MSEPQTEICTSCHGRGTWDCECCNGRGGCSCGGMPVFMGNCNACGGYGRVPVGEQRPTANLNAIRGLSYLGTGPRR